jgi:hypothetical protein
VLGNGIFNTMCNSATVWSSDSSLYFDGVHDFLKLTGQEDSFSGLNHAMSVSMWVRLAPHETLQDATFFQIYSRNNGKILFWWDSSAGRIYLQRWDHSGQLTNTTSVPRSGNALTNTHHTHLLFAINSGSMTIYVNGQLLDVGEASALPPWSSGVTHELYIGARHSGGESKDNFFSGWIHDVSIWSSRLSSSYIAEIYNEGEPSNVLELRSTDLKYYHNCSEKNFEYSDTPIPTLNLISSSNPILSGAIISRHDQIS